MKEEENIPELDSAGFDADGNDNYQPNKYYNHSSVHQQLHLRTFLKKHYNIFGKVK